MRNIAVSIILVAVSATVFSTESFALWGKPDTKTESGNAEMNLGEYKGLKHAIGCKESKNEAGWSGRWDLGRNLTAMLESALYDTGRFVLVEREKLGDVLLEQDLAASGRSAKAKKVAQKGVIRPARYIATGSVTEVSNDQSGASGGINTRFGRIGGKASDTRIALIVTLIDTSTSEIVAKERIEGVAGKKGLSLSNIRIPGTSTSVDMGGFKEDPIGQAAQDCINQAAVFIAKQMEEFPFEGNVIKAEDGEVIINRGSEYGVEPGQTLVIETEGETLLDPMTGAVLGSEDGELIGTMEVTKVREKFSYCKVTEGEQNPEVGSVVKAK
jgi:curli biogenesis system outer membrane secretion channel CsgG